MRGDALIHVVGLPLVEFHNRYVLTPEGAAANARALHAVLVNKASELHRQIFEDKEGYTPWTPGYGWIKRRWRRKYQNSLAGDGVASEGGAPGGVSSPQSANRTGGVDTTRKRKASTITHTVSCIRS